MANANSQPRVSVMILHHDGVEILDNCLKSVLKTDYGNYEVTVIDNGSTDGTVDLIRQNYSNSINFIRNGENLGFCVAYNRVLMQTSADYVALLNDDTEVEPNWLKELVSVAESDSSIAAVQAKVLSLRDRRYFEYNGAAGNLLDIYGYPVCMGRVFETAEEDKGQYDQVVDIFYASGPATFIRRSVLEETGLFDEAYFAHFDEVDLGWRMHLRGYRVKSAPKAVVYHLGGATLAYGSPRKAYLNHRNSLVTLIKNYSVKNLLRVLPLRLALEFVSTGHYMVKSPRCALAPLKSLLWIIAHLPSILRKRREVQRLRKVSDDEILKKMVTRSCVIQYFLMGRKTYFELKGLPAQSDCEYVR
ncbi:MAG: glycosyltransferase family 2 protein [Chloroflexi bacterium]|nr:glycosyltransferase family 2 protein [Chloroflexota bacterium]